MTSPTIELTVTLRVCPLNGPTVQALRSALLGFTAGPSTHLMVDLRAMDDRHEMSVYALLSQKARTTTAAEGNLTAIGPSRRLAHLLVATGIPVVNRPLKPHARTRCEAVSIGDCAA